MQANKVCVIKNTLLQFVFSHDSRNANVRIPASNDLRRFSTVTLPDTGIKNCLSQHCHTFVFGGVPASMYLLLIYGTMLDGKSHLYYSAHRSACLYESENIHVHHFHVLYITVYYIYYILYIYIYICGGVSFTGVVRSKQAGLWGPKR